MNLPARKPLRLGGWDYGGAGWYFITVCAKERRCIFSTIHRNPSDTSCVGRGIPDAPQIMRDIPDVPKVELTQYGELIEQALTFLDSHSERLRIDKYVIMPNHIHLILQVSAGGVSGKPRPTEALIPKFISSLKRYTNRQAGRMLWQTSYYDHIIRDEADYLRIWQYIDANPAEWEEDEYYAP